MADKKRIDANWRVDMALLNMKLAHDLLKDSVEELEAKNSYLSKKESELKQTMTDSGNILTDAHNVLYRYKNQQ